MRSLVPNGSLRDNSEMCPSLASDTAIAKEMRKIVLMGLYVDIFPFIYDDTFPPFFGLIVGRALWAPTGLVDRVSI